MVLVNADSCMYKNPNKPILINLYKTWFQMDSILKKMTRSVELIQKKMGNSLELNSTGTDISTENPVSTGSQINH